MTMPAMVDNSPMPDRSAFSNRLRSSLGGAGKSGNREAVRGAAEDFVSSALVLPVLSGLRESSLNVKGGPLARSSVEKRFGPLLDQRLADQITKAAKFSLVDTIVDRFAPPAPPAPSDHPAMAPPIPISRGSNSINVTA